MSMVPAELETVRVEDGPSRAVSAFSNPGMFEVAQRMAKALASSSLLPDTFHGNIPNCMIAMELANRIGCSVFMVAQNMDVIYGRPSWRAKFLIATVNSCGRFTPMEFRFEGKPGTDAWGCRAVATQLRTQKECVGPLITIGLAKQEGWYAKKGSKWPTMGEKMLYYRSAAWWADIFCPEIAMGMSTQEEIEDTFSRNLLSVDTPTALVPGSTAALEAELLTAPADEPTAPVNGHANGEATSEPPAADPPADVEAKPARAKKAKPPESDLVAIIAECQRLCEDLRKANHEPEAREVIGSHEVRHLDQLTAANAAACLADLRRLHEEHVKEPSLL